MSTISTISTISSQGLDGRLAQVVGVEIVGRGAGCGALGARVESLVVRVPYSLRRKNRNISCGLMLNDLFLLIKMICFCNLFTLFNLENDTVRPTSTQSDALGC